MSSAGGRSSSDRMIALRRSMSVVETQRDSRLGWELHASDEDGRALHDQAHSPERFGSGQSASCRKAFFAGDCETSSLVYLVLLACKRREPTASTPVSLRGAVLAMRLEDADFAAQNHLLRILKSSIELCFVGFSLRCLPARHFHPIFRRVQAKISKPLVRRFAQRRAIDSAPRVFSEGLSVFGSHPKWSHKQPGNTRHRPTVCHQAPLRERSTGSGAGLRTGQSERANRRMLQSGTSRYIGLMRSLASALAWGARGPGFKSRQPDQIPQLLTLQPIDS
jgi:hypothetical protein